MKRRLYKIGDFVLVFKTMMRDRRDNVITWHKSLEHVSTTPRLGQVVGICIRFDGYADAEFMGDDSWFHYFVPEKTHSFWLVRFGLANRPVCVAEEDMRFAVGDEIHELPYSFPPQVMSERDKQNLSVDSKHWPRDAKGRWVKGPVIHG